MRRRSGGAAIASFLFRLGDRTDIFQQLKSHVKYKTTRALYNFIIDKDFTCAPFQALIGIGKKLMHIIIELSDKMRHT